MGLTRDKRTEEVAITLYFMLLSFVLNRYIYNDLWWFYWPTWSIKLSHNINHGSKYPFFKNTYVIYRMYVKAYQMFLRAKLQRILKLPKLLDNMTKVSPLINYSKTKFYIYFLYKIFTFCGIYTYFPCYIFITFRN